MFSCDYEYILLNGLTYNPAEYFTNFERIFRALKGRGKMRVTSKNARQDYMSNYSIRFLLYDKQEKIDSHVFFEYMHVFRVVNGELFQTKREQQQTVYTNVIIL